MGCFVGRNIKARSGHHSSYRELKEKRGLSVSQTDGPGPHGVVSAANEFVCISAVFWVNFVVRFGFRQRFA